MLKLDINQPRIRRLVVCAIALVLVLTFAASLTNVPITSAQTKAASYAYVATLPNVIGLGQSVYITTFVQPPPPSNTINYDYAFTITKPNDETESIVIAESNVDATAGFSYTPDQLGTYTVIMSWPGNDQREGVTSPPATFTVQQDPVSPPEYPSGLPDYRWTYPISPMYREWYQISGAWPAAQYNAAGANFNPYTTSPSTPHILWTLQMNPAGLVGGETGHLSIPRADATRVLMAEPIAVHGNLYYTQSVQNHETNQRHTKLYCVDQYTGEDVWVIELPGTSARHPAVYLESKDMLVQTTGRTVTGFRFSLWVVGGGIWEVNPLTGEVITYWPDRSGRYHDGALYLTNYNATSDSQQSGVLTKWNTEFYNATWVKQIPNPTFIWEDVLVQVQNTADTGVRINTWNATTGELIVNGDWTGIYRPTSAHTNGYGKYFFQGVDMKVHAVSLYTGEVIWSSEPWTSPWGAFGSYTAAVGYDKVYMGSQDGHIYAYDAETGELQWNFYSGNSTETAQGTFPFWGQIVVADDKIYTATGMHTHPNPMPRGFNLYAFEANTGDLIWTYPDFTTNVRHAGISSGMLWFFNIYDASIYMFGKGETTTTINAPETTVPLGTQVLLQGTVMDQSPGSINTPAVSDESQSAWMHYLYNNAPQPTNATGVPVQLTATDPDGKTHTIGTTTTDLKGNYAITWTPPSEGLYQVAATFEGTNSYWASSQTTYFIVEQLQTSTQAPIPTQNPTTTPTPTIPTESPSAVPDTTEGAPTETLLIIGAAISIIAAVVTAAILLKKRR